MPRQSAAVYRRRRLAVLLILVLVLAAIGGGVWLAIAQPWADAAPADPSSGRTATPDAGEPSPSTAESADPSPDPSPDPSESPAIVACTDADVTVTAVTDADAYAAGELPKLSIALKNTSAQDCTMNVGSSTQKFTITSGSDVWWNSTDCQSDPSDMIVTLEAGASVTSSTPVVWDRTRSSKETCAEKNRPRAPGGGASYHVMVSIGGFESAQPKQFLLR